MKWERFRRLVDVLTIYLLGVLSGLTVAHLFEEGIGKVAEWQTLIAGVLAVLAAYLTIAEMRRAAAAEHQRHLNLEADRKDSERTWVERAITSQRTMMVLFIEECRKIQAWDSITIENFKVRLGELGNVAEAMDRMMKSRAIVEVSKLFGADAEGAFLDVAREGQVIGNLNAILYKAIFEFKDAEMAKEVQEMLKARAKFLSSALHTLVENIDDLAVRYGIQNSLLLLPLPERLPDEKFGV